MALSEIFAAAGVTGWLHAVDLSSGQEVDHGADEAVVPASVFKVPVLVELFRQGATGELDLSVCHTVPATGRAPGPTGLSVMRDPVTASLRDLAWLMIGISDNAATDVICEQVGLDRVNGTLRQLGCRSTVIGGDCRDLFASMDEDLAPRTTATLAEASLEELGRLAVLDPARSLMATTPRDMTTLLTEIWAAERIDASAAFGVQGVLATQVWPHRLASGFPEAGMRTYGKTGTLPLVRNEIGVVEYPDGGRYAVAVFTRARHVAWRDIALDLVIGRAARSAVDDLRARR